MEKRKPGRPAGQKKKQDQPAAKKERKGLGLPEYFESPQWDKLRRMQPLVIILTKHGTVENVIVKQVVDPNVATVDPRTVVPLTDPKPIEPEQEPEIASDDFDDYPPLPPAEEESADQDIEEEAPPAEELAEPTEGPHDEDGYTETDGQSLIGKYAEIKMGGGIAQAQIIWVSPDESRMIVETSDGKKHTLSNPEAEIEAILA